MFEDGRAFTAPKWHMLKAICDAIDNSKDERIRNILDSIEEKPKTRFAPDEIGFLQPVMSLLTTTDHGISKAARGTRSTHVPHKALGAMIDDKAKTDIWSADAKWLHANYQLPLTTCNM